MPLLSTSTIMEVDNNTETESGIWNGSANSTFSTTSKLQDETIAKPEEYVDLVSRILTGLALTFINTMTIGGNILVLVTIATNRKLRTRANSFIGNLAIADLTLGVLVLPFSATLQLEGRWLFGRTFCDLWAVIDVLCCTASIMSLCVISIDRYIGVTRPLQRRSIITRDRVILTIVLIWLVALAISLAPLIGWRKQNTTGYKTCTINMDAGYVIFSALGSFYLPALIILVIYTMIYRQASAQSKFLKTGIKLVKSSMYGEQNSLLLRVHSSKTASNHHSDCHFQTGKSKYPVIPNRRLSASQPQMSNGKHTDDCQAPAQTMNECECVKQPSSNKEENERKTNSLHQIKMKFTKMAGKELMLSTKLMRFKKEKRAAKTLGIVVGVFLVCWLPFFIILPLESLCKGCSIPKVVFDIVFWLGYCNSMLNPLIYAVWSKEFKRTYLRILRCQCFTTNMSQSRYVNQPSNTNLNSSKSDTFNDNVSTLTESV